MADYLDVVDEDDWVIGRETRERIHSSGLWHRAFMSSSSIRRNG